MTADVQEMAQEAARSEGARAWAIVLELVLGLWLLCLFLLAVAWDPIDRRIGARGRRIAQRAAHRSSGDSADGNAYAILPAE